METDKQYFDWNKEWEKQSKVKKNRKSFWSKPSPLFNAQALRQKIKRLLTTIHENPQPG